MGQIFVLRRASQADVIVDYVNRKVTFENVTPLWKHILELYAVLAAVGLLALFAMWTSSSEFVSPEQAHFTAILFYVIFVALVPQIVLIPDFLSMIPRFRERHYRKRTKRALRTYTIDNPSHIHLNGVRSLLDIQYEGKCAETVTKAELRKAKRRWRLEIFFSKPSLGTVTIKEY